MGYSGGVYPGRGGPLIPELTRGPAMTAYQVRAHEAAHALAALLRGVRVHRISIRGNAGSTFHEKVRHDLDAIACNLAGPAVEVVFGFPRNRGSRGDFDDANAHARSYGVSEEGMDDIIDELGEEIREHRGFIDSIIGELERNDDELSLRQIEEIAVVHGIIDPGPEPAPRPTTTVVEDSYPKHNITIAPRRTWLEYEKR